MATILKRLLTVCLALAFLVGVTAQLMPPMLADTPASVDAGMAGCCDSPQPPCTGHLPNCLDYGGCITVSALPVSPAAIPVLVEWTSFVYELRPHALSGISVKPELSPPILAA